MSETTYSIVFLMDPYESLNLETETSLLCISEILARGHTVYWLEQPNMYLKGAEVRGRLCRVLSVVPFLTSPLGDVSLADFDALIIRKDPPFDAGYLHLTYLLDFIVDDLVLINSPSSLRTINEKLYTLNWPGHCPDSLVTMDPTLLMEFVQLQGKVVLKPLDNCSGRGIRIVHANDPDLQQSLQSAVGYSGSGNRQYVLAQQFLARVVDGDKRIFLLDGEPVGCVNRIPASADRLANIHQGAVCSAAEITPEELEICRKVGVQLSSLGVVMAGLDFIDSRLTEINITSPSAVRQINEVEKIRLELAIVDAIIRRIHKSGLHECPVAEPINLTQLAESTH